MHGDVVSTRWLTPTTVQVAYGGGGRRRGTVRYRDETPRQLALEAQETCAVRRHPLRDRAPETP